MADVNGELIYRVLEQLQDRSISMDHTPLARCETRLGHIDRRLGLTEPTAS